MVRSWIRQALRASGVAILVPAAIAAAIALSVIGGGHDVASLGEVLHGPAIPPAEGTGLRGRTPQSDGLRGRTPQTNMQLRGQTPQLQRTAAPQRRPATLRRPSARPPVSTSHPPAPPPPTPPAPAQPSPGPPPPAPQPRPHPIHDTGAAAAETLRPLPLAGPAAADAVEAVVSLVDPA